MGSTKYQVRSISFPSRSHPSTVRVEEHLNNLVAVLTSPDNSLISNGVSMLEELYGLVDDLLNMGSTQQVLSRTLQNDVKHLEVFLESSVRLLDVCGVTRDLLLQTNERVREVQSAIRRRKGDSSLETCVSSYACFRKKAKKDIKKLASTLKQVEKDLLQEQGTSSDHDSDHFCAVMRVLRRVCATTVAVFQSLLLFVGVSELKNNYKSNGTKWSLVAKFIHKGVIVCEDERLQCVNEFQSVDSHNNICQTSLEALETRVDWLEKGLEIVFRRLIKTRASLLNIISH